MASLPAAEIKKAAEQIWSTLAKQKCMFVFFFLLGRFAILLNGTLKPVEGWLKWQELRYMWRAYTHTGTRRELNPSFRGSEPSVLPLRCPICLLISTSPIYCETVAMISNWIEGPEVQNAKSISIHFPGKVLVFDWLSFRCLSSSNSVLIIVTSGQITKDICEKAVLECTGKGTAGQTSLFAIIDAYQVPRLVYCKDRQRFIR